MTSRFRSNWAKEGPKSTSPTFESGAIRSHLVEDDYRREYFEDDFSTGNTASKPRNGSRTIRDRSVDDRNGKSRERNGGGGCYGDQRVLDDESESPDRSYYRRYKEDFRCRGAEVEDSSRERRAPIGKKSNNCGIVVAPATRYDLVEDEAADAVNHDSRLVTSTMTNGNSSSTRMATNGSSKQVKRYEERRDRPTTGSLTRERAAIEDSFPAINPRTGDATNRSTIGTNDRSNGRSRERSAKKTSIRDKSDEYYQTRAGGRNNETNDYGSLDRSRIRHTRERSQSPVEADDVPNGNGDSMTRRSDSRRRETSERFYSHGRRGDDEDGRSIDRRSRRHAEGRSYSPPEVNDDRMPNGNCDIPATRLERRDKRSKDEEFGSMTRRSSRTHVDAHTVVNDHADDISGTPKTNGSRGENGHTKKYRDIDNDDNSQGRKGNSKRKSHNHHKTSPEDFDVQIHRYERALRAPRRDSDLTRKSSFKDHDSDLSRKSSFEDHHRSRDAITSRKSSHSRRDSDVAKRGSSEDRDHEQVNRKSSFKNRDPEFTRKSSLTNRNLFDQSGNHRNNGSSIINRDSSESLRKDRDPSITRRRSSRSNNDDDDHDRSPWKNDRHSRPLTPPNLDDHNDRDDSRDRRIRVPSKDRRIINEDEIAHKYVQDHNECRSKTHEIVEGATQGRDRFSSSSRRVVSSRSLNDSRPESATRSSRIDTANNKPLLRDLADEDDPREDGRNSGFSTIERNGTTVIRIRTNSESPVGHLEPRARRRTSHQEVNSARYRKYEDEAEDEDEDDEPFERDSKHRDDISRRDYKIGPRRLWSNRDGGVQITDLDDGQPCLHCGETCPGFSPHSWRKNCTSCKCPREAHDVCHEEWVSVRARLGLKGEGPNNYVGFDPRDRGLTWAPPGLPPGKVEEYFSMLPEISVPRIGTPGERHRDRQLATQLPKQDLARAYCRHLDSQHSASADDFMAARNEIALDIGSVKEIDERGHECGVCHEPLKYGSLVVSASKLGLSYHPSCFQCTQCRELLVDLAYCVHDDALYCERHYAEQLKPRCAACDEVSYFCFNFLIQKVKFHINSISLL